MPYAGICNGLFPALQLVGLDITHDHMLLSYTFEYLQNNKISVLHNFKLLIKQWIYTEGETV